MVIHFIGIGGIGVSALARYYLEKGHEVSGSDLVASEITESLKEKGAKLLIGKHKAKNLPKNAVLVIYSPAVSADNPELKEAREHKIKTLSSRLDLIDFEHSKLSERPRLTLAEKRQMLQLRRAGLSYGKIAAEVKRSPSCVFNYLEPFESSADEAKALLEASAAPAAEAWRQSMTIAAADGNHKPAKDLLEAVGVVQPQETGPRIAIQINQPGAALPADLIDI